MAQWSMRGNGGFLQAGTTHNMQCTVTIFDECFRPDRRIHPNMLRHTFATLAAYFGACRLSRGAWCFCLVGALSSLTQTTPISRCKRAASFPGVHRRAPSHSASHPSPLQRPHARACVRKSRPLAFQRGPLQLPRVTTTTTSSTRAHSQRGRRQVDDAAATERTRNLLPAESFKVCTEFVVVIVRAWCETDSCVVRA